jgi:DDE superfamily endonuclease
LGNENELRRLAIDFTSSRSPYSPLHGCVGALDGVLFKISKHADKYPPAKYNCRKGYYALLLQVLVDSRYKVLYVSSKCAGATHDNLAFSVSTLCGTRPSPEGKRDETVSTTPRRSARLRDKG